MFIVFFVIFAKEKGIVSWLLSTKIFQSLGKISFVLFLWHIIFRTMIFRYNLFDHIPIQWRLALYVAICVLVAFPLEYCINSPLTRRLSSFHKKHPLRLEFFRPYVPLIPVTGAILLYLLCVLPKPVNFTSLVFDTMKTVCDKSFPVQVKIYSRDMLYIHPGKKPTSVIFQMSRCIDYFSCNVKMQHKKADVIVKFYLDEKLVKTIHAVGNDKIHKISFPCSKAGQLRIEVDKNGTSLCDGMVLKSVSFTGYPN